MKKGKHERKKFNIIEVYSVLILIATLFMSIGYAQISDVILNIEGTVQATSQQGVFITDVVCVNHNNVDTANSKINYYIGTMLDSEILLGDTAESSITYEISIHNNTDIEISLESIGELIGIEKGGAAIAPNGTISFPITFKYIDGADINNNTLESKLNFRFKEKPILELSNEGEKYKLQNIYPDYEAQTYEFTVKNYTEQENNIVPMSYYFDVTIDKPLTAKIYDENGDEVTGNINLEGNGETQATHTYTLKVIWDNSNEEENKSYDSVEYINEEFYCNVVLKAIPDDDKYLNFTLIKEFGIDITPSDYRENFNISYVDITNNNYPDKIKEGEDLQITFINEIPAEIEVTGCESYVYDRPTLQINNVTSDLEIKNPTGNILVFEHKEKYTFSGNNLLNTEIRLFNQENRDKDFEISFDVVSWADTQEDYATLVNSLYEYTPYPGILLRIRDNRYEIVAQLTPDNIHYAELSTITNFKFIRRNDIVYYKINNGEEVRIQNFQEYTDYFDTPVTFGGSLDMDNNPYRYFNGTLSNMQIILLDGEHNEGEDDDVQDIIYQYAGEYVFDGNNYINTGIQLFNEENINKDFEISFNIVSRAQNQSGLATLMNCLNEGGDGYPGIIFRIGANQYEIVANGNRNVIEYSDFAAINKFKFIKKDNILYYSINDGEMVEFLNYEGFTNYFNIPITFGASLDANGNPYRYFTGTLSNIVVKIEL